MVLVENKAKCVLSVKNTTKSICDHHLQQQIINDERILENNTYNQGVIELCELDSAKMHFIEFSKSYEIDKHRWFYEAQ